MNLAIIGGRLGATPELKYLPSGMAVCELRIATSETYTDKQGQRQEQTEWHSCTLFGKAAENASKYLEKGQAVTVTGRLRTRSWEMKGITGQGGNPVKAFKTDILVNRCEWGAKARNAGDGGAGAHSGQGGVPAVQPGPYSGTTAVPPGAAQAYGDPGIIDVAEDDIPF